MDPRGPAFFRRLTRRQLVGFDVAAAVMYTVVTLPGALMPAGSESSLPRWAAALIVAGTGLPVAVRRRWPWPVLGAVLPFSVAGVAMGVVRDPFLAAAAVLYVVALAERPSRWVPTPTIGVLSGVVVVAGAVGGPVGWQTSGPGIVVLGVAILGGAWALGRVVRERRDHAAYTAEQLTHQAVADERLRIARELHDVVAHSMSVITVKAGIANHVIHEQPDEAADALRIIETTGRSALTEMRHLLGVLRAESGDSAELGPSPGLAGLPAMADRARAAGVVVDLQMDVDDGLPEGVEVSVYRIAQEALTNVIKHAAPARCWVRIRADGSAVTVDVNDDGPGCRELSSSSGRVGHGLVGMHERAALYGGTFAAGPRPDGGFEVFARLPYTPVPGASAVKP